MQPWPLCKNKSIIGKVYDMMYKTYSSITFILLFSFCSLVAQDSTWTHCDQGLAIGEFRLPQLSVAGDSKIFIIKIDPHDYELKLLCSAQLGHGKFTIQEWGEKYKLIAAINAGMFGEDNRSNVGYMKNGPYLNNSHINAKFFSVAAFEPCKAGIPYFSIFDTDELAISEIIGSYQVIIQNYRLIKNPRINRWPQQQRKWSEAALGSDESGNILMIFCRSPYSMHDFNKLLLELPVKITCAQHLEGGPEASLYLSCNGNKIIKFGSYETGFNENDLNKWAWPIPNVIGVVHR
jgi:exopolysaccharide biosynthesis protein